MSLATKIVSKFYLQKTSSKLVYEFASEKLRNLSEVVSQRMGEFAMQDDCHARLSQALLWALLNDEKTKAQQEDVGINPHVVSGFTRKRGKRKKGEKDPDADLVQVCHDFMSSLGSIEKETQETLLTALREPDLVEKTLPIIDLKELLGVSKTRCLVLENIVVKVRGGSLFDRSMPLYWSCISCGWTSSRMEQAAPENCPLCGAPQSMMRPGGWGI